MKNVLTDADHVYGKELNLGWEIPFRKWNSWKMEASFWLLLLIFQNTRIHFSKCSAHKGKTTHFRLWLILSNKWRFICLLARKIHPLRSETTSHVFLKLLDTDFPAQVRVYRRGRGVNTFDPGTVWRAAAGTCTRPNPARLAHCHGQISFPVAFPQLMRCGISCFPEKGMISPLL